jgi:hypothetical protein
MENKKEQAGTRMSTSDETKEERAPLPCPAYNGEHDDAGERKTHVIHFYTNSRIEYTNLGNYATQCIKMPALLLCEAPVVL